MITFSQLLTRFRREVLADRAGGPFDDNTDLLPMLFDASAEVAARFGFPQAITSNSLSAGATTIPVPADLAGVQFGQVQVGSFALEPADLATVQRSRIRTDGIPTWYNFDPRRSPAIEIGPSPLSATTYSLEYTQAIDASTLTGSSEVWNGLTPLQPWVDLVSLYAGWKAFRALEQYDRADTYRKAYNELVPEFAAFLGNTNVAALTIPPEARNNVEEE